MAANFRNFIPSLDHPRVKDLNKADPQTYSTNALQNPIIQAIVTQWKTNLDQPYFDITSDGQRKTNLFEFADEGAPTEQMDECANRITAMFTTTELETFCHEIDSDDCRESNQAILALVQASTSETGYARVVGAMQTNEFPGELCNAKPILNKYIYQFSLYGRPSLTEPWGYSLFGHHLSLNIFVLGKQITASPIFLGAEPNIIDHGPNAGVRILDTAGELPLTIMQSLPDHIQCTARIFEKLHDENMSDERWNPADQRHLGGAFQDNRIIPYEGLKAATMPDAQQDQLLEVLSFYMNILPQQPYEARMQQIKRHWEETYFCWIGGFEDGDTFYYRIQSPVVMVEFDHHSGVFLLNKEPAKYHIHTIVRTPNGNDYGREWLRLYRMGLK